MKRIIIYLFVAAFASSALFYACSEHAKDQDSGKQNNDNSAVVVGHFLKDGSGVPEMDLTFEEAVYLIQKNNKLTKRDYHYFFNEAWIEALTDLDGNSDYYLASRATVMDQRGDTVYSCSSFYFLLDEDSGGNLVLSAPGTQYNCNGYCCSSCELKPADDSHTAPWCKCATPANTPSCQNEARCDQSTTIIIGGGGTGK